MLNKKQKKQPTKKPIPAKVHSAHIQPHPSDNAKSTLFYILGAFLFAFLARMYWYWYASAEPSFFYNNEVMINTNDGYYYAEGARDLIAGHHEIGDRSPVDEPISIVTAMLSRALPFVPFESLILFMPAFFGSLIVIPMVLIGRVLDRPLLGFLAALIASVTYSYYNRTMTGYYDSDMLALPLPMFVLYFLLLSLKNRSLIGSIGLVLFLSLCAWGYPQSFTLLLGIVGLAFIYALLFHRSERALFLLLALSLISISKLDLALKLPLVLLLTIILELRREIFERFFWIVFFACGGVFAYFGGFDVAMGSFKAYLLKDSLSIKSQLKFFDVVQTVREAGHIDFNIFSQRISGSIVAFFLSIGGYILLVKDKKLFILSLPLLALGFLAMKAGLRFTVYAVPVMAFGYAYLALFLSSKLTNPMKSIVVVFFMIFSLVPNLAHIYGYTSETVYTHNEAEMTAKLGNIAGREDYVYTWWDYGYPVRFYADVKNHSDGGKHDGATNFIESSILCSQSQRFTANMMREATEQYEQMVSKKLEQNISTFEYMLKNANIEPKNYEKYIALLANKEFVPTKKTREVYLYLPHQMLEIFTTINQFSNINLSTGESKGESFLGTYTQIQNRSDGLYYSGQKLLDSKEMKLYLSTKGENIAKYAEVSKGPNGKLNKKEHLINPNGYLNVIYMQDDNTLLLADEAMYNSAFVQMFILENYDKTLFEPVMISDELKIYKLKI